MRERQLYLRHLKPIPSKYILYKNPWGCVLWLRLFLKCVFSPFFNSIFFTLIQYRYTTLGFHLICNRSCLIKNPNKVLIILRNTRVLHRGMCKFNSSIILIKYNIITLFWICRIFRWHYSSSLIVLTSVYMYNRYIQQWFWLKITVMARSGS